MYYICLILNISNSDCFAFSPTFSHWQCGVKDFYEVNFLYRYKLLFLFLANTQKAADYSPEFSKEFLHLNNLKLICVSSDSSYRPNSFSMPIDKLRDYKHFLKTMSTKKYIAKIVTKKPFKKKR
jgi:hypothetical protein